MKDKSENEYEFENPAKHGVGGFQLDEVLNAAGIITSSNEEENSEIAKQYVNKDGTINESAVYNELSKLIASGSSLLKQFTYLDITAEGVLAGMASVMGELRQSISEFSKVHERYIKFQQSIKLEEFKEQSKLRLMERKHQMDLEKIRIVNGNLGEDEKNGKKITYDRNYIVKALSEAKKDENQK